MRRVDEKGRQKPLQRAGAAVFTEDLGSGNSLDMVAIPGGSFTMGSPTDEPERRPNEGPQHHVSLAPFFIGAAPITQAQWLAVVMAHPAKVQHDLNPSPSFFRGIDLPVESITWYEAEEYCRRLAAITGRDYRLPSEAAVGICLPRRYHGPVQCRADDHHRPGELLRRRRGRVRRQRRQEHRVRLLRRRQIRLRRLWPRAGGHLSRGDNTRRHLSAKPVWLYDMHGNVWEFCLDIATATYDDAPTDGSAYLAGPPDSNRILRGGSWSHNPAICRSAYRDADPARQSGLAGPHRLARGLRVSEGARAWPAQQRSLWFVTEVETAETVEVAQGGRSSEDVGGGFGSSLVQQTRKSLTQRVQINVDDLKREIGNLLAVVGDVFDHAQSEAGLALEEVELSIEVSSEGQISILGSGGKISGTGGIKLSFKRQRAAS